MASSGFGEADSEDDPEAEPPSSEDPPQAVRARARTMPGIVASARVVMVSS
ncbi:hypothetical protein [Nocardioides aurantiacus]|uniref:hypothetical protein n=1 Tax=Nocardioides aurantiacus TaxID=86796 RepID=UPI00403F1C65